MADEERRCARCGYRLTFVPEGERFCVQCRHERAEQLARKGWT